MYTEKQLSTHVQCVHTGVCLHFMLSLAQAFVQAGGHILHDFIQWNYSLKLLNRRSLAGNFAVTVTFPWTERTNELSGTPKILTQLSCKSFDWDRRNVMKCLSALPTLSSAHKTTACRDDRLWPEQGNWHLSHWRVSSAPKWLFWVTLQCFFVCDIDESGV